MRQMIHLFLNKENYIIVDHPHFTSYLFIKGKSLLK